MEKKIEIGKIIQKKFRKCLAIGALATSLVVSPIGSHLNIGNNAITAEAKAKKSKNKVKLTVKRAKANKKNKTYKSGKTYKEKYSIKLKKGKKKFNGKKYSIIVREKDKVLKVTPKKGIESYSKLYGVKRTPIKKGKKMSGYKVKYTVDPNVKMKLQETVTVLCTYIDNGKKHVKKKKIKNIRFIEGKNYKKAVVNTTPAPTKAPTQEEIDRAYEAETGEKLHIVETPKPLPTFNPGSSIIEEDPKDNTYYDDNGNVISSPEPLPTVEPTMAPNATPVPTEKPIENTHNGMTIVSDETSYKVAEENLLNQIYGNGIIINSVDPTINTLYFNVESGLIEENRYLDCLNLNAKDANRNDITNNIRIYDYYLKQVKENDVVSPIIIEVRDNNGNLYSQYLNISTKNINDPMDMPTGSVVISEDENYQTYYDMYQLSVDPVIFAKTDNMMMQKFAQANLEIKGNGPINDEDINAMLDSNNYSEVRTYTYKNAATGEEETYLIPQTDENLTYTYSQSHRR